MKKAVLSNKIFLPFDEDLYQELSKKLTYKFETGSGRYKSVEIVRLCKKIRRDFITMPLGCARYIPDDYEIIDKRISNKIEHFPEFRMTLRDDQKEVYDRIYDNGLIEANPGWGKTFVGCALAEKFKEKTLVIVDKKYLFGQWEEEVQKAFGFDPGVVTGGRKLNTEPPITIATVQTLHKLGPEYKNMFGLIIIDEVHKCLAKCFLNTLQNFSARYKLGLSATLGRKDGKHVLFPHIFSDARYKGEVGNELKPEVHVISMDVNSPPGHCWADRITNLCDDPKYYTQLFEIAKTYSREGYTPLLVVPRKNIIARAEKSELFKNWGFVHGDIPIQDRMDLKRKLLEGELEGVISEISCFTEGISVDILDVLILGVSINNIYTLIQLMGRITRPHDFSAKTPIIADIVLPGPIFKKHFRTRFSIYTSKQLDLKEVQLF